MEKRTITSLTTQGGPCGPDTEVAVEQVSGKKSKLTCSRCKATYLFNLPGGRVDVAGVARMEEAVKRLHRLDA